MSYRIMIGNQTIGTSELEYHNSAEGMVFGMVLPLAPYQAVRTVFLQFTAALPFSGETPDECKLAEYYAARDRLRLILETEDGTPLTTGFIHVVDWGEEEEEQLEIAVHVVDPRFAW
jgi:hypothetical protein